jgi:predicted dehydrogenase
MPEKIRIGFVGVGQIAQHHLRTYRDMKDMVDVVAAADVNADQLAKVASEFGIRNTYKDFKEMLKRDDIQAVDVCLHNNLHMPVTVAALKAGKDVYCEKPIAGSYIDGETMVKTARKLGRKLSIQLSTLYAKETRAASRLINDGKLGKIYHARSTGFRRQGRPFVDGYGAPSFVKKEISAGGALYDMGVYHIAQMLFLLGNPDVVRVSGKTYQETPINKKRAAKSGYNVEELGLGFVRFSNNVTLDIIESWAVYMDNFESSSIMGSLGGIRLNPFGYFHAESDMQTNSFINLDEAAYRWKNVHEVGDVYDGPQQHWIAALQGRVDLLPTADIALNTMLISECIYQSEKLGREVTADEVRKNSKSTAVKLY